MKNQSSSSTQTAENQNAKQAWNDAFRRFAHLASEYVGSASAFAIAVSLIVLWAILGPLFAFSDSWQLVINTSTTIVTFLIVFLIQNTQNRDAKAIHLKLDELIQAMAGARKTMVNLENVSDEELARLQKEFERLQKRGAAGRREQAA